ncbi:myocardin-related transcription factor B isoform X3 [Oreochromis aureus]|uniref:myocardin-related transcription factor B isoform X3 n=1 Tax=Oreochromis aureus TaxID=47969 RepID=UPI00195490E4|nr:myocardin-related transcription factor B isoform X3 [Oreochromis aureus]
MDVSIAVSLIRGQMGTVVERAVNGAVETVLAEMLKVVGVKFEELKAQVVQMKRDMMALQSEKAQKEKENDNIRAKLRYTELKLKYYRQGVEEELQQRASASTLVWIQPPTLPRTQRSRSGVSPTKTLSSFSVQTRTAEGALMRNSNIPECTSPNSMNRQKVRVSCPSNVAHTDSSDLLLPASLTLNVAGESLDSSTGGATYADSSTLHFSVPEMKQEAQEKEKEVIYIKEEPEEEQEMMATLLLDCHEQQGHQPESEPQQSVTECPSARGSQRNTTAFSSAGRTTHSAAQSAAILPPGVPPRQVGRPWAKDLSLYEEYKMRRSELRRRNMTKRRELEKSLPQPLLADLVRERREKTRLRVARWRAKRKLQACLNQMQAYGDTQGLSQTGFPIGSQHQQPRSACTSTSSTQQRQSSAASQSSGFLSNISAPNSIPLISSSSSTLVLKGPNMAPHEHAVASSLSYPHGNISPQRLSQTDTILQ